MLNIIGWVLYFLNIWLFISSIFSLLNTLKGRKSFKTITFIIPGISGFCIIFFYFSDYNKLYLLMVIPIVICLSFILRAHLQSSFKKDNIAAWEKDIDFKSDKWAKYEEHEKAIFNNQNTSIIKEYFYMNGSPGSAAFFTIFEYFSQRYFHPHCSQSDLFHKTIKARFPLWTEDKIFEFINKVDNISELAMKVIIAEFGDKVCKFEGEVSRDIDYAYSLVVREPHETIMRFIG